VLGIGVDQRGRRRLRRLPRARQPLGLRVHGRRPPLLHPQRRDGRDHFASIDIDAGYQRLCGSEALDYVRYRHGDNDLVRRRTASTTSCGRRARSSGVINLLSGPPRAVRLLGEHTRTDIRGSRQVAALIKLAVGAAGQACAGRCRSRPRSAVPPTRTCTPRRRRSTWPYGGSCTPRLRRRRPPARNAPPTPPRASGLETATGRRPPGGRAALRPRAVRRALPARRLAGSVYDEARAYTLKNPDGKPHRASGSPLRAGIGEYYGIQGTDWKSPQILSSPDEQRTLGSRTFELY